MEDALNMAAQNFSPQIAMALVGGLLGGLMMVTGVFKMLELTKIYNEQDCRLD